MKLTKSSLLQLIKEELQYLNERRGPRYSWRVKGASAYAHAKAVLGLAKAKKVDPNDPNQLLITTSIALAKAVLDGDKT